MTEDRGWEEFKDRIMEAAFKADEKSMMDMFDRDDVARELGIDTSDPEQARPFLIAVNQLVNDDRLMGRVKDNSSLSL